jgi:transposase InsO family protein
MEMRDRADVVIVGGGVAGYPRTIRVDQGSEFISRDLDLWANQRGVELAFSRPGKPTDNAFIESFNDKFRSECLNAHWFLTLDDAHLKMEEWRKDYNTVQPHSDRQQAADIAHERLIGGFRHLSQTPRKFRPGAIQKRGARQPTPETNSKLDKRWGQR